MAFHGIKILRRRFQKQHHYLYRCDEVLTGSYATDSAYNEKLNTLIAKYDLQQYDSPVKDKENHHGG